MTVLDTARQFLFVREAPGNTGARVEGIQRWCFGRPGDPWCCQFVCFVLDIYFRGDSPFPRQGACDVLLGMCMSQGRMVEHPLPGDIYFRLADPTDAVHVGFVTSPIKNGEFGQLSGNTSEDGKSNEGTGVFERDIKYVEGKIVFARLPEKE